MFSRSDKAEEMAEGGPLATEEKQRSPMVLAAIAGLLAVAGAFLLVRYLSADAEEANASAAAAEDTRLVLVVTQPIPQGTEVATILASPATYLASRDVPTQFVADSAIATVQDLRELDGLRLASDALVGEQLLRERFIDPSDFAGENFLSQVAAVEPPADHHTIVLNLAAGRALGGVLRPGDNVAVTATFRITPDSATQRDPYDLALVVLPKVEVVDVVTSAEFLGNVSNSTNEVGTSTVGDFRITLAVKPGELTDLVLAMRYGDIVLATVPDGASDDDDREFSTFATMLSGGDFFADNSGVDLILGNLVDPEDIAGQLGVEGEDSLVELDGALTDPDDIDAEETADGDDAVDASPAAAGNDQPQATPAAQTEPIAPPESDAEEPEPAGPGETLDQQAPIDDIEGDSALPPGN
ncbi:MAG: RcpC/CpaB family pilus assembly protein [Actinomycetota bacterium]